MKKSRFREEQMVTILRCRRARVGGSGVSSTQSEHNVLYVTHTDREWPPPTRRLLG